MLIKKLAILNFNSDFIQNIILSFLELPEINEENYDELFLCCGYICPNVIEKIFIDIIDIYFYIPNTFYIINELIYPDDMLYDELGESYFRELNNYIYTVYPSKLKYDDYSPLGIFIEQYRIINHINEKLNHWQLVKYH